MINDDLPGSIVDHASIVIGRCNPSCASLNNITSFAILTCASTSSPYNFSTTSRKFFCTEILEVLQPPLH